MYIKYPEIVQERIYYINGNVLNLCDRVNDICEKTARIERRQKVIKQTLMIMLLVLLLY
jgi:hypothetical protein